MMIKTLQKKYIYSAMIAVTIVMVIYIAAINILNVYSAGHDAEKTMQLIIAEETQSAPADRAPKGSGNAARPEEADQDGRLSFAQSNQDDKLSFAQSNQDDKLSFVQSNQDDKLSFAQSNQDDKLSFVPAKPDDKPSLSPEKPETAGIRESLAPEQYFTVTVNNDGEITEKDFSHIAQMTEEEAYALLEKVLQNGGKTGIADGYRFQKIETPSMERRYLFLDTRQQQAAIFRTLIVTLAVSALTWVLTLFLVIFFSRRAIAPVAENIERQKQFVTDAGHEIKTPLAIIQSNADVLELHVGSNKWIDNIRSQITRLSSLTQELLMLSRMEESAAGLMSVSFDAGSALLEALSPFRESAQIRGIRIHEDIPGGMTAVCPRDAYLRLLSILFENAVKYTGDGGNITVILKRSGNDIVIIQKNDTAAEMSGDPDRLFDRFYRSDQARTQSNGGIGIGLSVARALAAQLGGSIQAEYLSEHEIMFTLRVRGSRARLSGPESAKKDRRDVQNHS